MGKKKKREARQDRSTDGPGRAGAAEPTPGASLAEGARRLWEKSEANWEKLSEEERREVTWRISHAWSP